MLDWNPEEASVVREGRLFCLTPDSNNWTRRGRSLKMASVHVLLVTHGSVSNLRTSTHIHAHSLSLSLFCSKSASRNQFSYILISSLSPSLTPRVSCASLLLAKLVLIPFSTVHSAPSVRAQLHPSLSLSCRCHTCYERVSRLNWCIVPLPCHLFKITESVFSPWNSAIHRIQPVLALPHL